MDTELFFANRTALARCTREEGVATVVVQGECTAEQLQDFVQGLPFRTWVGESTVPHVFDLAQLPALAPAHLDWMPAGVLHLVARVVGVVLSAEQHAALKGSLGPVTQAALANGLALQAFVSVDAAKTWAKGTSAPPLPDSLSMKHAAWAAAGLVVLLAVLAVHARVNEASHYAAASTAEGLKAWPEWAYEAGQSWRYTMLTPFNAHDIELRARLEVVNCEQAVVERVDYRLLDCAKSEDPVVKAHAEAALKQLANDQRAVRLASLDAHPARDGSVGRLLREWVEAEDSVFDLPIGLVLEDPSPTYIEHERRWSPRSLSSPDLPLFPGFMLSSSASGVFFDVQLTREDSGEVAEYSSGSLTAQGSYVPPVHLLRYRFALTLVKGETRIELPGFVYISHPPTNLTFKAQRGRAASTFEVEQLCDTEARDALLSHVLGLIGA